MLPEEASSWEERGEERVGVFFFLSTVNFCGLDSTSGESCFLCRHHAAVLQPLRPL